MFRLDVYHHSVCPSTDPVLAALAEMKGILMATKDEVTAQIVAATAQTNKIIGEVQAATAALTAAIEAAGNSTPAMDAALASLKSALQVADDLNPDAPPPPPPGE